MYKKNRNRQYCITDFDQPMGMKLDSENRWVKKRERTSGKTTGKAACDRDSIDKVVTETTPWTLGNIDEGWEWLAFTFRNQLPFELTKSEIEDILASSDKVVQTAYKWMDISEKHKWTSNTEEEVNFIISECNLQKEDLVLDFGCGVGRHCISLAKKGITAIGIDYVDKNIEAANKSKKTECLEEVSFIQGDCREIDIERKGKAAICLYDVIGSYANNDENSRILKNINRNLEIDSIMLCAE